MKFEIEVTKTKQSNIRNIDFNDLPFGRVFTDHMFMMEFNGHEWVQPRIVPLSKLAIHLANLSLHYGQSIFEGMKASVNREGVPLLFRPDQHGARLNASARRMCMPEINVEFFIEAVSQLVYLEKDWIPPTDGSALYIRPLMFATDVYLGVAPSKTFTFLILTLPVGPYYSRPVKLLVSQEYVRAAVGGVGEAKTSGNYAAGLLPSRLANKRGYDQILWLDAREFKYIQEVGTMNIFFVINNKVITPALDGAVLHGITRNSFIQLLREKRVPVEERKISIDEVVDAHKQGTLTEIFGTGTAAVSINISEVAYNDETIVIDPKNWRISDMLKKEISDLRTGKQQDTLHWIVPVLEPVNA